MKNLSKLDTSDEIESEEEETAQEKKIRLAKSFIEELQKRVFKFCSKFFFNTVNFR